MLIEPAGVVNTGSVGGDLTAAYDDSLLEWRRSSVERAQNVGRPGAERRSSAVET